MTLFTIARVFLTVSIIHDTGKKAGLSNFFKGLNRDINIIIYSSIISITAGITLAILSGCGVI